MFSFSSPYARVYKASALCSFPCCFSLFFLLVVIISPFFLAFFTGGFWIEVEVKNLQPEVSLTKELLLFATDATGTTRTFSTLKDRYDASDNTLPLPLIKLYTEQDSTGGGGQVINLELGLPEDSSLQLYLGVDFSLSQNDLDVKFQGLLAI